MHMSCFSYSLLYRSLDSLTGVNVETTASEHHWRTGSWHLEQPDPQSLERSVVEGLLSRCLLRIISEAAVLQVI